MSAVVNMIINGFWGFLIGILFVAALATVYDWWLAFRAKKQAPVPSLSQRFGPNKMLIALPPEWTPEQVAAFKDRLRHFIRRDREWFDGE